MQNNLCTPKNGEILVASTQDSLTSSFLIIRRDTFYDRASFSLMCSYMVDAMDAIDLPTPALTKVNTGLGNTLHHIYYNQPLSLYFSLLMRQVLGAMIFDQSLQILGECHRLHVLDMN